VNKRKRKIKKRAIGIIVLAKDVLVVCLLFVLLNRRGVCM
jgi:hypothetical protein